jgi:hypothetical protein
VPVRLAIDRYYSRVLPLAVLTGETGMLASPRLVIAVWTGVAVRHTFATLVKTRNARFALFLTGVVLIGSYVALFAFWTSFFAEMTDWAPIASVLFTVRLVVAIRTF